MPAGGAWRALLPVQGRQNEGRDMRGRRSQSCGLSVHAGQGAGSGALCVVAIGKAVDLSNGPVLILGGGSDIAQAIARRFAREGHPIQLAARRPEELEIERSDIALRYNVAVSLHAFDALDVASHEAFVANLPALPEIALCAVGLLGDQAESERNLEKAIQVMRSNYEGPASILGILANHFEKRGSGILIGISSVAGDRGRASNYVYGSAKAGFTAFMSGLRNRLGKSGVHVLTVKPGFVRTRMVEGLKLPEKLTADPDEVGNAVYEATQKKKNVIYVRQVWMLIMIIIKNIPESIFKKLRL